MARFLVTTSSSFTGLVGGVAFAAGKATLDNEKPVDAKALRYFRRKDGYQVTALDDEAPANDAKKAEAPPSTPRPANDAKKAEWKAYAIAQGMSEEEAEKATRDQLAARFAEQEGAGQ